MKLIDLPATASAGHEKAADLPPAVRVRTHRAGDTFMGNEVSNEVFQTKYFQSSTTEGIRNEFIQMVHGRQTGEGGPVSIRSNDSRISEIIRSLPKQTASDPATAVAVKEIVHLGQNRSQATQSLSDLIRTQLEHVEHQLARGHTVVVRIATPESAQLAGESVRRLMRNKENRIDVRVTGDRNQKREIAASLGSKMVLKSDAEKLSFKFGQSLRSFARQATSLLSSLLPVRKTTPAARPVSQQPPTEAVNSSTGTAARRVSVADIEKRLEARQRAAENPIGVGVRPVSITVTSSKQLTATLEKLSVLKERYGDLLSVKLAPEVEEKLMAASEANAPAVPLGTQQSSKSTATPRSQSDTAGPRTTEDDRRAVERYLKLINKVTWR